MRTLILFLALPTAAIAAPVPSPENTAARCQAHGAVPVAGHDKATFKLLGELPPANHVLTVWRSVAGCPQPVVLREGIGAPEPTPER